MRAVDLLTVNNFPLWQRILVVPIYVGVIVMAAEACHHRNWCSPEETRKIVHIGTGNVISIAWWLELPVWVGIASALVAAIVTLLSYWLPILPGINSVGRKSFGTFFYAVSMGLLIAIFWPMEKPEYAVIGILVMAWGDGLAALVGQRYGRHPYEIWGSKKSWEGSIALGVVGYIVVTVVLLIAQGNVAASWLVGIPVGVAGVGMEWIGKWGMDNVMVPVGVAGVAYWLNGILLSS
jgi:phytol kinase